MKIRERLVGDLRLGAVIPPIVIGAVVSSRVMSEIKKVGGTCELVNLIHNEGVDLSIIDGMQRTTALLEASLGAKITQHIRVEFWIAKKVDDLIYRMLVLNTGQVPWDLKRQLETLYKPIVETVRKKLPNIRIISLDQSNRRSQAGEYRSTRVIELFLAYCSRSVDVDLRERVAEEFAKVDITEATSSSEFLPTFVKTLRLLALFDSEFSRLGRDASDGTWEEGKVKIGRDIFTSLPASIGFVVAVAELIFGSPGFSYSIDDAKRSLESVEKSADRILRYMSHLDERRLADFMDIATLNQKLKVQSGKIGEYERRLYKNAFLTLFLKPDPILKQGALTPCWLAHR